MKKILLSLILLSSVCYADEMNTLPLSERSEDLWSMAKELAGARLSNPIYIADVGTGDGSFILKIQAWFKNRGFERVVVAGIDNGSWLTLDTASQHILTEFNLYVMRPKLNNDTHYIMNTDKVNGLFDIAFLNAPHPRDMYDVVKLAKGYIKPEGFIALRFHLGDQTEENIGFLQRLAVMNELSLYRITENLPKGTMPLEDDIFILSRAEFTANSVEIRALQIIDVKGARVSA